MRITKQILMKKLEFLCKLMNKPLGYKQGQWWLDYTQCYGGYIIVEYQENGGEHHPLLNKRLTAKHMSDALDTAINIARNISECKTL